MKKLTIVAAVASIMGFCAAPAIAAPTIWGNVYTDMLINDNASEQRSQIIGIEGGVSTNRGTEFYGFFEHNPDLENEFGKLTVHSTVIGDFGIYGHTTIFKEGDFSENRYVVAAGYQGFVGDGYAFKPYVGAVRIDAGEEDTSTEPAFGYAGYYAIGDKTSLSSWADARVDDDRKVKVQGSVGVQHDLLERVYVGAFYNMNYGEQGQKHFSDSVQLRVGYKF
ncbi:MAG: hypothetical protein ACRC6V_12285 [Bacteroidales bacterium]